MTKKDGKTSRRRPKFPAELWDEVYASGGVPRGQYAPVLERFGQMQPEAIRRMEERTEATMREMGVTFDSRRDRDWVPRPWACDLLPQIFRPDEWSLIERGFEQRLWAFELFLRDIYGPRRILRENVLPIAAVLGSPYFVGPATGIRPTDGRYLHLSGICLTRLPGGELAVKSHYFSHPSGIAYMMQNRRAMARVNPAWLDDFSPRTIADAPLSIFEKLRGVASEGGSEPLIVLLSPGPGSSAYPEHALLARRMGIAVVQGADLVVLEDKVFLKTVGGLERVSLLYARVDDPWLDPMVFRPDSLLGVPGLTHCIRRGTVGILNGIGSRLADDRALLAFSWSIIRYYLGETPVLPVLETAWLGDPDMRALALDNPERYRFRPLFGERVLDLRPEGGRSAAERRAMLREIVSEPHRFIAQPVAEGAVATCFEKGYPVQRLQDHLVFGLSSGEGLEVFSGALTRVSAAGSLETASELGGGSKDTWVLPGPTVEGRAVAESAVIRSAARRHPAAGHGVMSRVAESFYWLGRYLERSRDLASMLGVITSVEAEEMNAAERALHTPVWGRILPPLEGGARRRGVATAMDRYRIVLDPAEPGSIAMTLRRAIGNAESVQDVLSPEAWSVLGQLWGHFEAVGFEPDLPAAECPRVTRRLTASVLALVPQYFATAETSMLSDDAWRFCLIGRYLERAIVTANALVSIAETFRRAAGSEPSALHAAEIQLSAFLRLLGSRDAYRRVFQMRAAPVEVLEFLCRHPEVPRSICRCLRRCSSLLAETDRGGSRGRPAAIVAVERLAAKIGWIHWRGYFGGGGTGEEEGLAEIGELISCGGGGLSGKLEELLSDILALHQTISDGFLSHQEIIGRTAQSEFPALVDVL